MDKKPESKTVEPPQVDEVKAKAAPPVQFGPTASAPGSRLKKR
jgi:hypothetical protein